MACLLFSSRIALLFGAVCCGVGYLGSILILQELPDSSKYGLVVWLVFEVGLCLVRELLWALKVDWTLPRPLIVLENVTTAGQPFQPAPQHYRPSSSIGWTFEAPAASHVYALIIGVGKCNAQPYLADLRGPREDGERVERYLKNTLNVPPNQVFTLYDERATKRRIEDELTGLMRRRELLHDATILIYFAGHSVKSESDQAYLVPHLPYGLEGDI